MNFSTKWKILLIQEGKIHWEKFSRTIRSDIILKDWTHSDTELNHNNLKQMSISNRFSQISNSQKHLVKKEEFQRKSTEGVSFRERNQPENRKWKNYLVDLLVSPSNKHNTTNTTH